ncbi:MAG: alpha-glucosidase/alpha-galactosidase, partial [Actinomycetota bacterium]|nr:alpha-glucosidase/alpha-galactosidase [Actinomycetota bacterium]
DRRRALTDADHVITMFQVGGYEPSTVIDFEIPKRYGLRQTIGDTLGIGGIMRGLRTIPVLLDICSDMEDVCPDALLLNYVNPMSMLCWAVSRASSISTIGLCHSVQGTARQLAGDLDIPFDEMRYRCAGINHMAFYSELERHTPNGEVIDLYPLLAERAKGDIPSRGDPERSDGGSEGLSDAVRYEVFRRLGRFVTESSEHFAEYVPWFIKEGRGDLLDEFGIPLDEYPRRCVNQIAGWEELRERLEDPDAELTVRRSEEYGAGIIHSTVTGEPRVVYGNVPNHGLIDNLPEGCSVEVPCLVDSEGIHPERIGAIEPHLAALMQTNINVQGLTVEAVLSGRRDHVYHAAMVDPHTAAELDISQIWAMCDDLIEAHGEYIPEALR